MDGGCGPAPFDVLIMGAVACCCWCLHFTAATANAPNHVPSTNIEVFCFSRFFLFRRESFDHAQISMSADNCPFVEMTR